MIVVNDFGINNSLNELHMDIYFCADVVYLLRKTYVQKKIIV